MFGRIVFFTSCATVFSGTAYVVGVALTPPPSYTVNNQQRLEQYDALSKNDVYEKKTRGQEFYLGISRWRRRLLRDEGLVRGRVLEVGAGCGGSIAHYDALLHSLTNTTPKEMEGVTSDAKRKNDSAVVEVVLSDRSPGMVESAARRIQERYGYKPYHYPDYDIEGILGMVEKAHRADGSKSGESCTDSSPVHQHGEQQRAAGGVTVKKKILHGDGTVVKVLSMPLGVDSGLFMGGAVAPILQDTLPGNKLPLLNHDGWEELRQRDERGANVEDVNEEIFSVANYAAEQLPFADNSFDTVVDMFGLCSFDDPVRALREMSRVCKPSGNLLLLEHGKGRWPRMNEYLDKWAPRHAKKWGCWWNRDIRRYMRLAGLTVIKSEEKHFGTSQYIVAKPFKTMDEWERYHG